MGTVVLVLAAAAGCGDPFSSVGSTTSTTSDGAASSTTSTSSAGGSGGGSAGTGGTGQAGAGGQTAVPCRALQFDGSDDFVSVPPDVELAFVAAFTVEAWIYLESSQAGAIVSNHYVNPDLSSGRGWVFEHKNSRALTFRLFGSTGNIGIGGSVDQQLEELTWYHVAAVYSGSQLTLFTNGAVVAQQTVDAGVFNAYDGPLHIGRYVSDAQGPFHGVIDEVRLSSGARYSAPFAVPTHPFQIDGNTIALWHFNELSGDAVVDATGAHGGTLGKQLTVEPADPLRLDVPCIDDLR